VHVALTGETTGYYADFAAENALAKVTEHGFFHDGTFSSFRGRLHGAPIPPDVPTWRLVTFAQDHDQVGNRAAGDRLSATLSPDRLAVAAVLTLTTPGTPMLFMGEEWGASTPWQFFTSHPEPELGRAVAEGRTTEFARMGWDRDAVPDPQDPATFARSHLDWSELDDPQHARMLALYRDLVMLRRECPALTDPDSTHTAVEVRETDGTPERRVYRIDRGDLSVLVNLASTSQGFDVGARTRVLLSTSGFSREGSLVTLPSDSAAVVSAPLV